ncbi:MAG: 30S ribosomal protein S6 [bacterium]|nr:30S ribosomal protein S6 [bacterium]
MQSYSLTVVAIPELEEQGREQLVERIRALVEGKKGSLSAVDIWGKRTLAYPIRHKREGTYIAMNVSMDQKHVAETKRDLSHMEDILRALVVEEGTLTIPAEPKAKEEKRKKVASRGTLIKRKIKTIEKK